MEKKSFLAKNVYLITTLLILILIGLGGFFVYTQVDTSNKVAINLNQSIDKINQNRSQTTSLINQIIDETSKSSSNKDSASYKITLDKASNEIADLLEKTAKTKSEIADGPTTDTAEFALQTRKLMDYRSESLTNFQNLVSTSLCYNDKLNLIYNWVPEFDKQWGELNSNSNNQAVIDLANKTSAKIDESQLILPELINCFKTNFSDLIQTDENVATENEVANYKNLSASLKKFATSITTLNQADYNSSSAEIKKISQSESVFQKTSKDLMDRAIEKYANTSEQKITAQEQVLNLIIRNLKAKYRLDTQVKLI